MKNVRMNLMLIVFGLMSMVMKAQDKPSDYFLGKWDVLVQGTPSGDAKMNMVLAMVDGKMQGGLQDEKGVITTKFDKIEGKNDSLTVYFVGNGYNVYITLDKKEDNKAVGSLMDMFDATAVRVVETKK